VPREVPVSQGSIGQSYEVVSQVVVLVIVTLEPTPVNLILIMYGRARAEYFDSGEVVAAPACGGGTGNGDEIDLDEESNDDVEVGEMEMVDKEEMDCIWHQSTSLVKQW